MGVSPRPARVGQVIQQEIAGMLTRRELKDPRIGFVTITGCKVAPDLKHAVIYYSVMTGSEGKGHEETQAGLEAASGFLRRQVTQAAGLRHAPTLVFKFDASVENGARIETLLREVREQGAAAESGEEPSED